MPAYMDDGCNNVERLIANMDFAQVNGAVVTQEYIDGNQDEYLLECKAKYPDRIRICSLYEENDNFRLDGWQKQIELACNKNVYVESSGITWLFNSEFYPYPSAVDAILEAKSICGMEKLMWGSDYPRTMTAITYRMSQDFITKSDKMTEADKKLFLGENAKNFYRFADMPDISYTVHMAE